MDVTGASSPIGRASGVRMVAFDFDGTLAETREAVSATVNAALAAGGLPRVHPPCIHGWMGLPLETLFDRCLPPHLRARGMDVSALVAWYRARFAELGEPQVRAMPDARDLLDRLRREGLAVGIVTSRERSSLDRLLDRLALGPFDAIIACHDAPRGKPDAAPLLALLDRVGLAAEAARMVGDTSYDVTMARAAGVRVAAVLGGCHDAAALRGADVVLERLGDVAGWLAGEA